MRWARIPLLHFLAGGAALFWLVHRAFPAVAGAPATPPIIVSADDVAQLRAAYTQETGLPPTPADEVALIEKAVEEELLFREAVARGLDRNDRSVRNWLIEQMRVLADGADSDEDDLYARARALELDRKDLVVRRILVQKMRLLASRAGEGDVGEAELRAFYAQHQEEYRLPERVSLWQVFLGSQRHGGQTQRAAQELLAALRSGPADPADAATPSRCRHTSPHSPGRSSRSSSARTSRTRSCAARREPGSAPSPPPTARTSSGSKTGKPARRRRSSRCADGCWSVGRKRAAPSGWPS
jgi:hypothetical protein